MRPEAAASGERLPRALEDDHIGLGVAVDRDPDVGELTVRVLVDRVEARTVQRDPQHSRGGTIEPQMAEIVIAVEHATLQPTA